MSGSGLEVFRRVQAPLRYRAEQPTSMARRSVIGVDALVQLIGGGIFDGSTTMVVGVSGVGKTVLGTQLLREGVLRRDLCGSGNSGKGLLVSLDEHPAQILRNAATLGLNLKDQVEAGEIHILFEESAGAREIDVHFARIVRLVRKARHQAFGYRRNEQLQYRPRRPGSLQGFFSRPRRIQQIPPDVDFF